MANIIYPTNDDDIEPESAKYLYEHSAILLIENLPVGSQFGIDLSVFQIGEKFKGVKLIPPGIHFVFASPQDRTSHEFGPRCGFYHFFKTKELLVKRWSVKEEEFDETFIQNDDYIQRYSSNIQDLDRYLGAYRFSTYRSYLKLVDKITPALVERLKPRCNIIRSIPFLVKHIDEFGDKNYRKVRSSTCNSDSLCEVDKLLHELKPAEATRICFSKIPRHHLDSRLNISKELVTSYHLDSTIKLDHVFSGEKGRNRLLGEFQFAFVTLLLGHVYDCLEHWKELLTIVCMADSAIKKYPTFFQSFVDALIEQLKHIPEDLFEDTDCSNNLIQCRIETLIRNASQTDLGHSSLLSKLGALKNYVELKFKWRLNLGEENVDDNDQPIIVEF